MTVPVVEDEVAPLEDVELCNLPVVDDEVALPDKVEVREVLVAGVMLDPDPLDDAPLDAFLPDDAPWDDLAVDELLPDDASEDDDLFAEVVEDLVDLPELMVRSEVLLDPEERLELSVIEVEDLAIPLRLLLAELVADELVEMLELDDPTGELLVTPAVEAPWVPPTLGDPLVPID